MQANKKRFHFQEVEDNEVLDPLKREWRNSLLAPQDGMWEAFTEYADHWAIIDGRYTIGYACIDGEGRLLQFYVLPQWMQDGPAIFQQLIEELEIKKGMVGTNNPIFLSMALHVQRSVEVNTYLFTDLLEVAPQQREGTLRAAAEGDLKKLVNFCHNSMGAPEEWLSGYLSDLINKEELFMLEMKEEVLGTCEVRKSLSNPDIADLGMIVSPDHRRKGLGTYLLGKAKEIAMQKNKQPICSCEKDNPGSLKAIHNNGFRSKYQMLLMNFEEI